MNHSPIVGCLLGTAVGDALGLPYERLSPRRAARLLGPPDRHRLLFGRGMVSDDTEHACLVARALIESAGDGDRFVRRLGRHLRWWLLGLPAGLGSATLRATLRLWCGFSPRKSGVYSAGNGPAMRSAILGAAVDDLDRLRELVRLSTRITHTDPKAEYGALAVALAARAARQPAPVDGALYLETVRTALPADERAAELLNLLQQAVASAAAGEALAALVQRWNWKRGISGYVYHTVPAVIQVWLRHPRSYRDGVMEIIAAGGDADTTAAILGGLIGTAVGRAGIPEDWLRRLLEWPRSVRWMEELGGVLERVVVTGLPARAPRLSALGLLGRNLLFLFVVLVHAFRRLLPPY